MNEQEKITQTAYRNINMILNRIVTMLQTAPNYDFYDDIDDLGYFIDRIHHEKLGSVFLMNGIELNLDNYKNNTQGIFGDIKKLVVDEQNKKDKITGDVKQKIGQCLDELSLSSDIKSINISHISNSFLNHIFNENCDYEISLNKKDEKIVLKLNNIALSTNIFKGFGE